MNDRVAGQDQHSFDARVLLDYLRESLGVKSDSISITRCVGGHSNLNYLVELEGLELILRRPPMPEDGRPGRDMSREFKVLSAIAPHFPLAPEPTHYCPDPGLIGTDFLLLERFDGNIIRNKGMKELESSREKRVSLLDSFTKPLADLHRLDHLAIGLGDLSRGPGYAARQVATWIGNYGRVRRDDLSKMETVSEWLRESVPDDAGHCLIHNDYKLDNLMLDPGDPSRVIGVLDWEMATIGDPLMDLGMTVAYWIPAESADRLRDLPFNPRFLMEEFHRESLIRKYVEHSGRDVRDFDFYHVFGLFKAATFAQSIYVTNTSKPGAGSMFDRFPLYVEELARLALKIIESRS